MGAGRSLEATEATCSAGVRVIAMMPYMVKYSCVKNVKHKNLHPHPAINKYRRFSLVLSEKTLDYVPIVCPERKDGQ